MKFSIIAIALTAAIFGKASPVPQGASTTTTTGGGSCTGALKVFGFARIAHYTVLGSDFSQADIAAVTAQGKYDNYSGPVIAGALARSDSLPGPTSVFVQAENANYFFHKSGDKASVLQGLAPDTRYSTYVEGDCSQFASNAVVFANCCQ